MPQSVARSQLRTVFGEMDCHCAARAQDNRHVQAPPRVVQSDIAACGAARGARPGRQLHPWAVTPRPKTAHAFRRTEHFCRKSTKVQAPEAFQVLRRRRRLRYPKCSGRIPTGIRRHRYAGCWSWPKSRPMKTRGARPSLTPGADARSEAPTHHARRADSEGLRHVAAGSRSNTRPVNWEDQYVT